MKNKTEEYSLGPKYRGKSLTKKLIIILAALLIFFLVSEIALRKIWGFCQAPLFYASKKYEYMPLPNQDGIRFGNHYHFNSFSQRSNEPNKKKKKILGLGDSVIYGGTQVDQDSLASTIFTNKTDMQMLNISAPSWGPDNAASYLAEKGLFNASAVFLLVNSHDAHDDMTFVPTVGINKSYPNKQYSLAWIEVLDRYLLPKIGIQQEDPAEIYKKKFFRKGAKINAGFDKIKKVTDSLNIPFIVYLHAEKPEMSAKKYNNQGQEIITWARKNHIKFVQELDYPFVKSDYLDDIHFNTNGQKKLAQIMIDKIKL